MSFTVAWNKFSLLLFGFNLINWFRAFTSSSYFGGTTHILIDPYQTFKRLFQVSGLLMCCFLFFTRERKIVFKCSKSWIINCHWLLSRRLLGMTNFTNVIEIKFQMWFPWPFIFCCLINKQMKAFEMCACGDDSKPTSHSHFVDGSQPWLN